MAEFERGMARPSCSTTFGRRGKFMLLGLEDGRTLIVHLRMTGRLLLAPPKVEPGPHTHVVFTLDEGERLFYRDARKFGRLWLVPEPGDGVGEARPGAIARDVSADHLAARLAVWRKVAVKTLLLDQSIVAGVGNIYADEALFRAVSLSVASWRQLERCGNRTCLGRHRERASGGDRAGQQPGRVATCRTISRPAAGSAVTRSNTGSTGGRGSRAGSAGRPSCASC